MKTRDILVAFIVIVAVVAGVLLIKNRKVSPVLAPSAAPSVQKQIETKFKGLVIPADAEKIELKNVSGGDGMGIATRNEILADLPGLPGGQFYQVWLGNAGKTVLLGNLKMAKGGWILNYNSSAYPGYDKVIVTAGGKHILEGSF